MLLLRHYTPSDADMISYPTVSTQGLLYPSHSVYWGYAAVTTLDY